MIGRALIYLATFTHSGFSLCSRGDKRTPCGKLAFPKQGAAGCVQWGFRTQGLVNHQIFNLNAAKSIIWLWTNEIWFSGHKERSTFDCPTCKFPYFLAVQVYSVLDIYIFVCYTIQQNTEWWWFGVSYPQYRTIQSKQILFVK